MHQRIAFFDFDGTITTKDTLLEFIKYSNGKFRFYLGFLVNSPWLVAYKCKIIPNQSAKEKVLGWFFRKCPFDVFQEHCDRFAAEVLPGLIRPKALLEIAKLQGSGATVVIVSASPENWISGWALPRKIDLIATRLEMTISPDAATREIPAAPAAGEPRAAGRPPAVQAASIGSAPSVGAADTRTLTGKIEGKNCYGGEKVRRIQEAYSLEEYSEIYAYGDTSGDRPMLKLGTLSFYKPFR
jgi:phosphatidylglycerophosphatase C